MTPRSDEHPLHQANDINERETARAAFIREARNVSRAFALYTEIHGMRNAYRAEGQ